MKFLKNIVFLCLLFSSVCLAAQPVGCPMYYPKPENKLLAVSVFNSDASGVYELAPAEEPESAHIVTQYWDDINTDSKMPAFVTCSYLGTKAKITIKIPVTTKVCKFIFYYPSNKNINFPAKFFCN